MIIVFMYVIIVFHYIRICLFIHLFINLHYCLFVYMFVCLYVYVSMVTIRVELSTCAC
jgi:hypothetical protein